MTNGVDFPETELDARYENDAMRLWLNGEAPASFTLQGSESGIDDSGSGKGLLTLDYDKDGDMDLFVVNNAARSKLYRNEIDGGANWVRFELLGRSSNSHGIGARISLLAHQGAHRQVREVSASSNFLGQDDVRVHFGLGAWDGPVDSVRVRWPSGAESLHHGLAVGRTHRLLEPEL